MEYKRRKVYGRNLIKGKYRNGINERGLFFNLRFNAKKNLEKTLLELSDFVEEIDGIILMLDREFKFNKLSGLCNKARKNAENLNSYLPDNMKIDFSEYDKKYQKIIDKVKNKNKEYLEKECEKLREKRLSKKILESAEYIPKNRRCYEPKSLSSIKYAIQEASI